MENQPTLAYVCQKRTRAGPKMGMDPVLRAHGRETALKRDPA